jgi:SAM-dependent methyltransferase
MRLEEVQKHWNAFAKNDPFWAILTASDKENGRWKAEEFFATGKSEIDTLMESVASLNWNRRLRRALDFGCGVGRLSQALCKYFEECYGVDIASEMLRLADGFNRHGSRCLYRLNTENDLRLFSDNYFDFIYSNIVLQHMQPEYASNYIREFLRILAPGGLIVFQVPSEIVRTPGPGSDSTRLPETAFHALIRPVRVERSVAAATETQVVVNVKNISNVTWPRSSVCLGNHWLRENGEAVVFDDARAELRRDLLAGSEIQFILEATAPGEPGVYFMELDMVQEGVAWFSQHGSKSAIFPVQVEAAELRTPEPTTAISRAQMEMYGMSLESIVGIVTQSGGRFVEIKEDACAGPNWRSYRYSVTKNDGRTDESRDRYCVQEHSFPKKT